MRTLCIFLLASLGLFVAQGFGPLLVAQGFSPALGARVAQGFSPALSAASSLAPQRGAAPAGDPAAPQRGGAPGGRGAAGGRGGGVPAGPVNARAQAPIDLTGYWVSVITEDWRYRMVTAPKGDHPGLPLAAEGTRVANAWDPAKDEAAGEQCKAYGAGGVMRAPGKLHITWDADDTLKMDLEAGTQTRLFKFGGGAAAAAAPVATNAAAGGSGAGTWQGVSVAQWETAGGGRGRGGRGGGAAQSGDLKVVTTKMKPGYSQKNGVPYGENAVLTEYYTRTTEPNGDSWLIITHVLEDSQYQSGPFIRSTQFKKLPDSAASSWAPEACSAR